LTFTAPARSDPYRRLDDLRRLFDTPGLFVMVRYAD
jgi:hypothetical protein